MSWGKIMSGEQLTPSDLNNPTSEIKLEISILLIFFLSSSGCPTKVFLILSLSKEKGRLVKV